MTIEQFIKDTRELCERATPGPWKPVRDDHDTGQIWFDIWTDSKGSIAHIHEIQPNNKANAAFIAASRTALPLALAALEKATEALKVVNRYELTHYEDCESLVDEEQECDCGIGPANYAVSSALVEIDRLLSEAK